MYRWFSCWLCVSVVLLFHCCCALIPSGARQQTGGDRGQGAAGTKRPANWEQQLEALQILVDDDPHWSRAMANYDQETFYCDYNFVQCDGKGNMVSVTVANYRGVLESSSLGDLPYLKELRLSHAILRKTFDLRAVGEDGMPLRQLYFFNVRFVGDGSLGVLFGPAIRTFACVDCDLAEVPWGNLHSLLELDLSLNPYLILPAAEVADGGAERQEEAKTNNGFLPPDLLFLNLSGCNLRLRDPETKLIRFLPSSLRVLDLSYNGLSGELPFRSVSFKTQTPQLERVDLSYNNFQFSAVNFPVWFGVEAIQGVSLSFNPLQQRENAVTLQGLGELPGLHHLELAGLGLQNFEFVNSGEHLPRSMSFLNLSHNFLHRFDLVQLHQYPELTTVDLSHNKLEGTLDLSPRTFPQTLEYADFSYNLLSGTLDCTNLSPLLRFLLLDHNRFTGELDLLDLPVDLRKISVGQNDFELEFPPDPLAAAGNE